MQPFILIWHSFWVTIKYVTVIVFPAIILLGLSGSGLSGEWKSGLSGELLLAERFGTLFLIGLSPGRPKLHSTKIG